MLFRAITCFCLVLKIFVFIHINDMDTRYNPILIHCVMCTKSAPLRNYLVPRRLPTIIVFVFRSRLGMLGLCQIYFFNSTITIRTRQSVLLNIKLKLT